MVISFSLEISNERIWSKFKHLTLGKYIIPWSRKLGSTHKVLYVVDGFAGRGKYKDGTKGSPLIFAEHAKRIQDEGWPCALKCINVEREPSYWRDLKKHSIQYKDLVRSIKGDFRDHISDIVHEIGDAPAFFFLDPFGLVGIEFEHLRPIFERKPGTELVVNFSLRGLHSLAGKAINDPNFAQKLDEILGFTEWRKIWEELPNDPSSRDSEILKLYRKQLLSRGGFHYVASHLITARLTNPKYYLIYATRFWDGVEIINDIWCGLNEEPFFSP